MPSATSAPTAPAPAPAPAVEPIINTTSSANASLNDSIQQQQQLLAWSFKANTAMAYLQAALGLTGKIAGR